MGDIKHKKFDMNLGSRPSHARLRHNWNLMNASQVPEDVPFTNTEHHAPTQQHDRVSGGQGGESGRIVQMSHIDSTLDWRNPLPPSLSLCLSLLPSHHQWQKVRLSLFKGYASVELREQEWCHKFPPGTHPSLFAPLELLSGFKEQQIKKLRKKKNERKEN